MRLRILASIGCATLLAVACGNNDGSLSGSGGGSGDATSSTTSSGTGGAASCGPTYLATDTCKACVATACCAESAAAAADATWLACVDACAPANHACFDACLVKGAPGPGATNLKACELNHCKAECPFGELVCGGTANVEPSCDTCIDASCCAEAKARNESPDALRYIACLEACDPNDAGCGDDCLSAHPDGAALADTTGECVDQRCHAGCASLPQVACIGKVTPPALVKAQLVYAVTVLDYQTKQAVAVPLTLKLCASDDVACASPLAQAVTDGNATASMTLPVSGPGFTGYLDVSGAGYSPTLYLFDHPLVDDVSLTMAITTNAATAGAANVAGTSLDPMRGLVAALTEDCQGAALPHMLLAVDTADASSTIVYAAGGLVAPDATETDASALAIAFNVPAQPATVSAAFALTHEKTAQATIPIRAGAVTQVALTPN